MTLQPGLADSCLEPLGDLRARRSEIGSRLDRLPAEIEAQQQALRDYINSLKRNAPWWRRLLRNCQNETARGYLRRLNELEHEALNLNEQRSRLEMAIEKAQKIRKRFLDAQIAQNAADARRAIKA